MDYNPDCQKVVLCKKCKGTGRELREDNDYLTAAMHICPVCNGHGRVVRQTINQDFTLDEFPDLLLMEELGKK